MAKTNDMNNEFTAELEQMLNNDEKKASVVDAVFGFLKGGALQGIASDLATSHKEAVAVSMKANIGGIVLKNTVDLILAMMPKHVADKVDDNPIYRGMAEFVAAQLAGGVMFFMARNSANNSAKYIFVADSVVLAMQTRMFTIFNVEGIVDHMLAGVKGKLESAINGGALPADAVFNNPDPATKPM